MRETAIDTKRARNLKLETKEMKTTQLDLRKTKEMELDWKKTKEMTPDMKKMKKTNPDMKETKERTLDARRGDLDLSETDPEPWTSMQKDLDTEEVKETSSKLNGRKMVSPRPSKIKMSLGAQIDPLIHQAKKIKKKRPNVKEI